MYSHSLTKFGSKDWAPAIISEMLSMATVLDVPPGYEELNRPGKAGFDCFSDIPSWYWQREFQLPGLVTAVENVDGVVVLIDMLPDQRGLNNHRGFVSLRSFARSTDADKPIAEVFSAKDDGLEITETDRFGDHAALVVSDILRLRWTGPAMPYQLATGRSQAFLVNLKLHRLLRKLDDSVLVAAALRDAATATVSALEQVGFLRHHNDGELWIPRPLSEIHQQI